jgi:hypothetical protein
MLISEFDKLSPNVTIFGLVSLTKKFMWEMNLISYSVLYHKYADNSSVNDKEDQIHPLYLFKDLSFLQYSFQLH